MYPQEPQDKKRFTQENDRAYGRFAAFYDVMVKIFPVWQRWISAAIPEIRGTRVLEVSPGSGFLLPQIAKDHKTCAIDYNFNLLRVAKTNVQKQHVQAHLQQADVAFLPYADHIFDTVVNTMAFSAYADGERALAEINRVLKPGGRFVLVDIDFPENRNLLGVLMTLMWISAGDMVRDMQTFLHERGFQVERRPVGGFGSIHLFVALKVPEL